MLESISSCRIDFEAVIDSQMLLVQPFGLPPSKTNRKLHLQARSQVDLRYASSRAPSRLPYEYVLSRHVSNTTQIVKREVISPQDWSTTYYAPDQTATRNRIRNPKPGVGNKSLPTLVIQPKFHVGGWLLGFCLDASRKEVLACNVRSHRAHIELSFTTKDPKSLQWDCRG